VAQLTEDYEMTVIVAIAIQIDYATLARWIREKTCDSVPQLSQCPGHERLPELGQTLCCNP
jgi:hypothetical protein